MSLNFVNIAFVVISVLVVILMIPFWKAVVWGVTFAIVFAPVYNRVHRKLHNRSVAAGITLLVIMVLIAIPVTIAVFITVNETERFIENINSIKSAFQGFLAQINQISKLKLLSPYIEKLDAALFSVLQNTGVLITKNIGALFSKTYNIITNFIFSFIITFYLLRDSDRFVDYLGRIVGDRESFRRILDAIRVSINATVLGGVVTALIQGFVGAIGFLIVGLNAFFMWMFLIALFSFVPLVGTAIVWLPAAVYLLISGNYFGGIFIAGWGVFAIGMIDNYIRPLIIGSKLDIHPMLLFFGILGAIIVFGPIGIIVGPVVLSMGEAIVRVYVENRSGR